MKEILKLNPISPLVREVFKDKYSLVEKSDFPVGIMVRSFSMHGYSPADSVLCVGRAGAGTNNVPTAEYAEKGIVVFNTPGANANAVKELTIAALLLASRNICGGTAWANGLSDGEKTVAEQVEKGKKAFGGSEIFGKTLGVYGLGAIGKKVAEAASALGMRVIGYDPYVSVGADLKNIEAVGSRDELFNNSDYVTLHVPLTDETRSLINAETISEMKDGVKIINCSRGEIVDSRAVLDAIESGKVSAYVTDFPSAELVGKKQVICIPHLGASTQEAEDNCAVMAASQIIDYVENGNVVNSVNFPTVKAEKSGYRTVILYKSEKDLKDEIQKIANAELAAAGYKKGFGDCLIDSSKPLSEDIISALKALDGVVRVRQI